MCIYIYIYIQSIYIYCIRYLSASGKPMYLNLVSPTEIWELSMFFYWFLGLFDCQRGCHVCSPLTPWLGNPLAKRLCPVSRWRCISVWVLGRWSYCNWVTCREAIGEPVVQSCFGYGSFRARKLDGKLKVHKTHSFWSCFRCLLSIQW